MIVRELITRLGWDADESKVKGYDSALKNVAKNAAIVTGAVSAATAAVGAFVRSAAIAGNEVAKAATEAGLSTKAYQELTFAIGQVSRASEKEVSQGFNTLNNAIGLAAREGGRYEELLKGIGFSYKEIRDGTITTEKAFAALTNRMRSAKTDAEAASIASELLGQSIGAKLGPALRRGEADVQALRDRFQELGGGFSDQATRDSEQFVDNVSEMRVAIRSITTQVASEFIPAVNEAMSDVLEWVTANRKMIRQAFHRTIEITVSALREFWTIAGRVLMRVNDMAKRFGGWEKVLRFTGILLAGFVTVKTIAMFTKLASAVRLAGGAFSFVGAVLKRSGWMAVITGIGLLVEDMWHWVHGNESALGKIVGDWESAKEKILGVIEDIRNAYERLFPDWFRNANFGKIDVSEDEDFDEFVKQQMEETNQRRAKVKEFFGIGDEESLIGGLFNKLRGYSFGRVDNFSPEQVESNVVDINKARTERSVTHQLNIKSEAVLQVPQGTTEQQQAIIREQAQRIVQEQWDKEIRGAIADMPGVD